MKAWRPILLLYTFYFCSLSASIGQCPTGFTNVIKFVGGQPSENFACGDASYQNIVEIDPTGTGYTYTWEYSYNGGPYITIPSTTVGLARDFITEYVIGVSKRPGFYKIRRTVTGSNCSLVSVPINLYYSPNQASITGGFVEGGTEVCYGGSNTLSVNGQTGPVLRWESKTGSGPWTTIPNSSNFQYTYSNLTENTCFRALVDNICQNPVGTIDASDKYSIELCVTVNPLPNLSTTQTNVSCFGGSTGAISLTVTSGSGGFTYLWTKNSVNFATTQSLSGLTVGTYQVQVTDSKGCGATQTVTITQPAAPLALSFTQTNVTCFGESTGGISITATGGSPTYSYSWSNDGTSFTASTQNISGLRAGIYQVRVTDANGCLVISNTINITEPTAIYITETITPTPNPEDKGSIDLDVGGGTGSYTYVWTKEGDSGFTSNAQNISELGPGSYSVTVKDTKGCLATETYKIEAYVILSGEIGLFEAYFNTKFTEIVIRWSVSSELNESTYVIERSLNGLSDFKALGAMEGTGKNSENNQYTFVDTSIAAFQNSFYFRIKKLSGSSVSYSRVKFVKRENMLLTKNQWLALPNPSQNQDIFLQLVNGNCIPQTPIRLRMISSALNYSPFQKEVICSNSINLKEVFGEIPLGLSLIEISWNSEIEFIKIIRGAN